MARAYLGFIKDGVDGVYVAENKIRHIETVSTSSVEIHFDGDNATAGSALITTTANKADDVAKEIARIACTGSGVITIADSLNSVFAHADITACTAYTINNS